MPRKIPSHGVLWNRLLLLTNADLSLRNHLTQLELVQLIEESKQGIALLIEIQKFKPTAKSRHYQDKWGLLDVARLQSELSRLRRRKRSRSRSPQKRLSAAEVQRLSVAAAQRWKQGSPARRLRYD